MIQKGLNYCCSDNIDPSLDSLKRAVIASYSEQFQNPAECFLKRQAKQKLKSGKYTDIGNKINGLGVFTSQPRRRRKNGINISISKESFDVSTFRVYDPNIREGEINLDLTYDISYHKGYTHLDGHINVFLSYKFTFFIRSSSVYLRTQEIPSFSEFRELEQPLIELN